MKILLSITKCISGLTNKKMFYDVKVIQIFMINKNNNMFENIKVCFLN